MVTWEVSLVWGQVNSLVKRFAGVGVNYVWCLLIVIIFMRLGIAKRWGGGGVFKAIIWMDGQFLWDPVDPSRHHAYNIQPGNCSFVN